MASPAGSFPRARSWWTLLALTAAWACSNGPGAGASPRPASSPPTLPRADLASLPEDHWARALLALEEPIRSCLGATPGPTPRATGAWPRGRGRAEVRTRNGEGGWFACVAPADGGSPESLVPLAPDTARRSGEGQAVFTLPGQGPAAGGCWEHERVEQGGRLVGWLSHDTC